MKIRYTYSEYKDFPEATEISKSRALGAYTFTTMSLCGLAVSLILLILCESAEDWITGILSVLFFAALLVYMLKYYPKATERKIQKVIEDRIKLEKSVAASKYSCQYIEVLNKFSTGMCNVCYEKNKPLTFCNIKKDIGTRNIYVCEECIQKFKNNK